MYTKSDFYETVDVSLIFSASHCPLNVTSGMVWTTKGIDCFNSTTRNAKIPLYKFRSSTFSPDWYCADFYKYIWSIIKIQSWEKRPFHEVFLPFLTQQYHLVEYYLTVTKIVLEIFQIITCTLGVRQCKACRIIDDKCGGLPCRL